MNREVLTIDYNKLMVFVDHQIKVLEEEEENVIRRGLELIMDGYKPDEILGEMSAKIEEWMFFKNTLIESTELFK
jgi:hypothetical protein